MFMAASLSIPSYLSRIVPQGAVPAHVPGQNIPLLARAREAALQRFLQTGLPTPREEDWRYTRLSPLEKNVFQRMNSNTTSALPEPLVENSLRLVFNNGRFDTALSSSAFPDGLNIRPLHDALQTSLPEIAGKDSWHDLNLALFEDGAMITLAPGIHIALPVELLFLHGADAPSMQHMRHVIALGEGAQMKIIERHLWESGEQVLLATAITHARLAKGAKLHKTTLSHAPARATLLLHDMAVLAEDAGYDATILHLGKMTARHKVRAELQGACSTAILRAVNSVNAKGQADLITDIHHMAAETRSEQNVRSLAGGEARAVFQGRVTVAKEGQKTIGQQTHHGLLLSDKAEIDAKPSLEIYADDVQCSHGATCGALDEEALFYLRSRGIPRREAEGLLLEAFVAACLDDMADAGLRDALLGILAGYQKENAG
jgi:Fe-S cluster assembly protein SufD